jgi:hypothetical protein
MRVTISIRGYLSIGSVNYERRLLDWTAPDEITAEEANEIVAAVEDALNHGSSMPPIGRPYKAMTLLPPEEPK